MKKGVTPKALAFEVCPLLLATTSGKEDDPKFEVINWFEQLNVFSMLSQEVLCEGFAFVLQLAAEDKEGHGTGLSAINTLKGLAIGET